MDFEPEKSIKVRSNISDLGYYNPPLENRNPEEYVLMDFNEPPLPPHDDLIEEVVSLLKNKIHIYPAYEKFLEELSNYVGVNSEKLLLTNGSDQAVDIIFRCILESDDEIKMVQPGFAMFSQVAGTIGCLIKGPQFNSDFSFPHEKLISSISKNTGLIVVINPNNPTGTSVSQDQIEDLLISFPFIKISLGPEGQLDEITGMPDDWASINTLGRPSYLEVKISKSEDLIYSKAFFL